MDKALEIFEKHWTKSTGKPLDEMTKNHMKYAIEAIHEALSMMPEFVYECVYNPSTSTSSASTISIHTTKKGAEMAMEFDKNEKLKEYNKECQLFQYTPTHVFDFDQYWGVRETKLHKINHDTNIVEINNPFELKIIEK